MMTAQEIYEEAERRVGTADAWLLDREIEHVTQEVSQLEEEERQSAERAARPQPTRAPLERNVPRQLQPGSVFDALDQEIESERWRASKEMRLSS